MSANTFGFIGFLTLDQFLNGLVLDIELQKNIWTFSTLSDMSTYFRHISTYLLTRTWFT